MSDDKKIDFTQEERTTIAEYVYSHEADILIVSDATNLLEVLNKHNLVDDYEGLKKGIANKESGITSKLFRLLMSKVQKEQGVEIMNEYFGKKTN